MFKSTHGLNLNWSIENRIFVSIVLLSHSLNTDFLVAGAADSRPVLHDEAVEARLQLLLHRKERLPERRGLAILRQRRGVRRPQHVHAQQCRARYYLVWRK